MNSTKKKTCCLVFICFSLVAAKAQIVNIERARMQSDTTGWMGNAGSSFSLTKNKDKIFSTSIDAHVQYKSKRSLYLFLGNYGFLKAAGQKLIDNTFFHIRYNYKIDDLVRWEVFTQLQQNAITGIQSRFLAGTGPRFKLASTKFIRLYAGVLVMYEREKETTAGNILHKDLRNSSYISLTITPNKQVELISTSFFQPVLNNWRDYRFLCQASLRVKAAKRLGMRINWNYLYDSYPVPITPPVNYNLGMGIDYDF